MCFSPAAALLIRLWAVRSSFVISCRQNKLEEALLFSGQFTDALQALIDWLYRVEPQLAEDQPVHGDIDLVLNLIDNHKVDQIFQASNALQGFLPVFFITLPNVFLFV